MFEKHTLEMAQVKEVERLGQGIEHNLAVIVFWQQQAEVVGDEQTAGLGVGEREELSYKGFVKPHIKKSLDAVLYLVG